MLEVPVDASALIDCGVASSALPGQTQSGDLHLVKSVPAGVLIAVVDGLGHGAEAANAVRKVVTTIEGHASESVMMLLHDCRCALKRSRGAGVSLAVLHQLERTLI